MQDLNDFIADLDKRARAARVISEPVSPDLEIAAVTDRVSQVARRRPGAAVRAPDRLRHAGRHQPLRVDRADVPGARRARRSTISRGEIDELTTPKMPAGMLDALKMLPMVDRLRDLMPKTVKDAPCQEVVQQERHARRAADPEVLAGGRRPLHHAAAGLHQGSRDRHAQHRHLPDAGVRRPHAPACTGSVTRAARSITASPSGWASGSRSRSRSARIRR